MITEPVEVVNDNIGRSTMHLLINADSMKSPELVALTPIEALQLGIEITTAAFRLYETDDSRRQYVEPWAERLCEIVGELSDIAPTHPELLRVVWWLIRNMTQVDLTAQQRQRLVEARECLDFLLGDVE